MKVQIPWDHLEDSDLVPLGGTQEYGLLSSAPDSTVRSEGQ